MKPAEVLTVVLTEAQRAEYFAKGYLVLPEYVPAAWVGPPAAGDDRNHRAQPLG